MKRGRKEGTSGRERRLRRQGTKGHNIGRSSNTSTSPSRPTVACPGPRDPTTLVGRMFPEGNQRGSSSLSRTRKLQKANGLVWPAPCGESRRWLRLAPKEERKLKPQSDSLQWADLSPKPQAGHWPSLGAFHLDGWLAVWGVP